MTAQNLGHNVMNDRYNQTYVGIQRLYATSLTAYEITILLLIFITAAGR